VSISPLGLGLSDSCAVTSTLAYNAAMKKSSLLGGLDTATFLRDYWHKQPLLIRAAIPDLQPVLSRDALFALVQHEDVESRLITYAARQWKMEEGPFDQLPPLTQEDWTVLVQGVNLHDVQADALMRRFRFIPDTRLDDLMISYATKGGGVGAHFDSYDVFLLQAHGHRRWRISAQTDLDLVEGVPLKILKNFQPEQEFILGPGDMLYLPPQYAHEGVALDECMTYSIGFRAPSYQELGEAFLESMIDTIDLPGRYADPDLKPTTRPAELSSLMLSRVSHEINKMRFTKDDITLFMGSYLSEPKLNVQFDLPETELTRTRFAQHVQKTGIQQSRKSIMLYRENYIFINGTSFEVEPDDRSILATLANTRELSAQQISSASEDVMDALHAWYKDGWLVLAAT